MPGATGPSLRCRPARIGSSWPISPFPAGGRRIAAGWPACSGAIAGETQARDSLRQSLAALRQAFRSGEGEPLQAERESVTLTVGLVAVDAVRFADLCETAPDDALALYTGDLLEGVDGLTAEFEAWLRPERERLTSFAVKALERVAETGGSSVEVLRVGRRLLAQDPTREPVVRAQMRLLARSGERSEALKLYTACRDAL